MDTSYCSETQELWLEFFRDSGIDGGLNERYAAIFHKNRMKMSMLEDLEKDILKDMGIAAIGDIIAILRHAKVILDESKVDKYLVKMKSPEVKLSCSPQRSKSNQRDDVIKSSSPPLNMSSKREYTRKLHLPSHSKSKHRKDTSCSPLRSMSKHCEDTSCSPHRSMSKHREDTSCSPHPSMSKHREDTGCSPHRSMSKRRKDTGCSPLRSMSKHRKDTGCSPQRSMSKYREDTGCSPHRSMSKHREDTGCSPHRSMSKHREDTGCSPHRSMSKHREDTGCSPHRSMSKHREDTGCSPHRNMSNHDSRGGGGRGRGGGRESFSVGVRGGFSAWGRGGFRGRGGGNQSPIRLSSPRRLSPQQIKDKEYLLAKQEKLERLFSRKRESASKSSCSRHKSSRSSKK